MGNPTLAQLANPPPFVEESLKARFAVLAPDLPCLIPRENLQKIPAEYVGVTMTMGSALQRLVPLADGTFQRDAWNYVIEAQVETLRKPKGDRTYHSGACGRVTNIILEARYDSRFLAWHVLTTLGLLNQTESVKIADRGDITTIRFGGMICVKSAAWGELGAV